MRFTCVKSGREGVVLDAGNVIFEKFGSVAIHPCSQLISVVFDSNSGSVRYVSVNGCMRKQRQRLQGSGTTLVTVDTDQSTLEDQIARREERSPTNWIATIRLRDGTEIPCTVKDVSKSGAKIGVSSHQALPPVFMLRIIGRDFLCLVRLAWRRGDYAGVRIERVGKVPNPAQAAEAVSTPGGRPINSGGIGVPSRKRGISAF